MKPFFHYRAAKVISPLLGPLVCFLALTLSAHVHGDEPPSSPGKSQALALFEEHCFACHSDGTAEGKFSLDELLAQADSDATRGAWWSVLKNIRAEMMPPKSEPKLVAASRDQLIDWLEAEALGDDAATPDPGHVTLRRLNRSEYRHTIHDLMGIDFAAEVEFPPDDTGHGFDTVGDAMSVSPLLMEKYLQAAEQIVFEAVPMRSRIPRTIVVDNDLFKDESGKPVSQPISFYQPADLTAQFAVEHGAEYNLEFDWEVRSSFDFDPGRCRITLQLDGEQLLSRENAWGERGSKVDRFTRQLDAGAHLLRFILEPLVDAKLKQNDVRFELDELRVIGPTDRSLWVSPEGYERFFPRAEPPQSAAERAIYAREVLQQFASRAFRRPVDDVTLDRLTNIVVKDLAAEKGVGQSRTFEQAVARGMVAVLASPRFLFRIEEPLASDHDQAFPRIDEYSLASRLSYFLWSTMPDQRLWDLAKRGRLRDELATEVERMLADERFRTVSQSFVGQWLQTRDVETISVDPLEAVGARAEYEALRDQLREKFDRDREQYDRKDHPPELQLLVDRYRELRELRDGLTGELRRDLRHETEEMFHYIASHDQSLLELIDSNYSFLNRRLAKFYGLTELDESKLSERDLRRTKLPAGSPRGGLLGQGSFLMVTSNPTRTSPVKRGLFILDNILGTPSPPPPGVVPALEAASAAFPDRQPTLRELLAHHREDALCASCHQRFDPLGLALENFNALGMWRDTEAGMPIDTAGELITGETFENVQQLKQILVNQRRGDFYRCFATKLMTYALGRGPEYHDELSLDQIVGDMEASGGQFSAAVLGVIRSPPFDRMRSKNNSLTR